MPTITGLFVYPVKSLKGIGLTAAEIGKAGGFIWDRHWLVVRTDGRFLTQRQLPRMALVETALPPEALLGAAWGALSPDAALTLCAPGMDPLQACSRPRLITLIRAKPGTCTVTDQVPLAPPADAPVQTMQVTCWGWSGIAQDEGDEAASWLSDFLQRPVRLVRYMGRPGEGSADADPTRRPIDPQWQKWGQGFETTFPDQFPLLMTSEERGPLRCLQDSLRDLNTRLDSPLPMNRFRPNIVVRGEAPFAEDGWAGLRVGGLELSLQKPCGRCKITTTNQTTAAVGQEPLRILQTFRSGKLLKWFPGSALRHDVYFGWHMATRECGQLKVGDHVDVTNMRISSEDF